MADEMTLVVRRCEHGVWHSHNAFVLPDGSTVADPAGRCPGGVVSVEGRTFHISQALAMVLRQIESDPSTEED